MTELDHPSPDPPSASAGQSRLLWLGASLAFLIPVAAGLAIGLSLLASPATADDPGTAPSSAGGTTAEPVEPPESAAEAIAPIEFSSQSGNLRCYIDADTAYCHQGAFVYSEPVQDCAADGVAIGVTSERTYWACIGARPPQGPPVDYDVPVVNGEFTCVINYVTGVTCRNANGRGFTMEYTAGVVEF